MGYPSNITKEQFEHIRPILESARKKTAPRKLDLHDIFNGLLYIVDNGCKRHALPNDYPKYKSVHYTLWSGARSERARKKAFWNRSLKKSVGTERTGNGRKTWTSFIIVDTQSV